MAERIPTANIQVPNIITRIPVLPQELSLDEASSIDYANGHPNCAVLYHLKREVCTLMRRFSASIENLQALDRVMTEQPQLPLLAYSREQIDQYMAIESAVEVNDIQEEALSTHSAT